jgi:hypothetical protein
VGVRRLKGLAGVALIGIGVLAAAFNVSESVNPVLFGLWASHGVHAFDLAGAATVAGGTWLVWTR